VLKLIFCSLTVAIAMLAIACGDDDGEGDATPTPSVCDAEEAFQQSVTDLTDINVVSEGTNALNAAVANVKTELDDLKTAVGSGVADEVDDLETAVSDAEDTLSGIDNDATLNEKIDDVQSAFTGVATAAAALKDALSQECS
jgi:hypothetical protein